MKMPEHLLVFPDGGTQSVGHALRFEDVVDVNGYRLPDPLPQRRMLAYRVYRISTKETRNEIITEYHLAQLTPEELASRAPE